MPKVSDMCYDCGSTISGHHTPLCDFTSSDDVLDLPAKDGSQHWTGEVPNGLEDQVGTYHDDEKFL